MVTSNSCILNDHSFVSGQTTTLSQTGVDNCLVTSIDPASGEHGRATAATSVTLHLPVSGQAATPVGVCFNICIGQPVFQPRAGGRKRQRTNLRDDRLSIHHERRRAARIHSTESIERVERRFYRGSRQAQFASGEYLGRASLSNLSSLLLPFRSRWRSRVAACSHCSHSDSP
jgi:hypothetical protein